MQLAVSQEESLFEKIKVLFAQSAATLCGVVLFAIGFCGRMGIPLYPVQNISFLTQPMPLSATINNAYWTALAIVGIWLTLYFFVRLAAALALALIGFKWAVLQGYFVVFFERGIFFP
jgi:hypothetical protein